MVKAFLAGVAVTLFVLLVVALVLVEQRKENARKADIEYVKELTIRHREDSCAVHIGELKGAKHEAALKWFHSFSLERKEHRMSEDDLTTCLAF
jgi:hypothetical protein